MPTHSVMEPVNLLMKRGFRAFLSAGHSWTPRGASQDLSRSQDRPDHVRRNCTPGFEPPVFLRRYGQETGRSGRAFVGIATTSGEKHALSISLAVVARSKGDAALADNDLQLIG